MVVNMKELYDYYADYEQVQFVTVSVDPDHDSLEALNAYAAEHGVTDERWVFLRGDIEAVVAFCTASLSVPRYNSCEAALSAAVQARSAIS